MGTDGGTSTSDRTRSCAAARSIGRVRGPRLRSLHEDVRGLKKRFERIEFEWAGREDE